jgi:hypothetical protein
MIRHEPVTATAVRGLRGPRGAARPEAGERTPLRQRLAELWEGVWRENAFDATVAREVRRYLGCRAAEPGDVVAVNRMIRELDRSFTG